MAILKRGCEETPTPVRDSNPAIPDWLADLIARLQAKDPAQRYQSAAEVAELLGRHLAHVQHPSAAPAPVVERPAAPVRPDRRRRVVAAAALLLATGLGLSEATGLTNVRATVSRFFTPQQTREIEPEHPARAEAPATGTEPVGTPVVSEPVRPPQPEAHPFVILAHPGRPEQKLDTLAEAVRLTLPGDTIEVRANGPFPLGTDASPSEPFAPIVIREGKLRIRAGEGFRPVFHVDPPKKKTTALILTEPSSLVVEGLDFQQIRPVQGPGGSAFLYCNGPLSVANCRFVGMRSGGGIKLLFANGSSSEVRNCQFIGREPLNVYSPSDRRAALRNNIIVCIQAQASVFYVSARGGATADLQLTRNTFVGGSVNCLLRNNRTDSEPGAGGAKWLRVRSSGNVCDLSSELLHVGLFNRVEKPAEVIPQWISWAGDHNLYSTNARLNVWLNVSDKPVQLTSRLTDWRTFWGDPETGSVEGRRPRYLGGDVMGRSVEAPAELMPEDFRLHPESAGHAAGPDGQDLGADVSLVGPGPAYERWKKTPAYQEWLKTTGQEK
jgi:hypothetical protein